MSVDPKKPSAPGWLRKERLVQQRFPIAYAFGMAFFRLHLNTCDASDQSLYLEAALLGDETSLSPDPEQDPIAVKWAAGGQNDEGVLYINDDETENTIEWASGQISRTTLLARAPNGQWRPIRLGVRVVLDERGVGSSKATYTFQSITLR